ncbi:MAG: four helix bundle suffix domain-containing protein [Bacteroidaceae bacterium]|nr:four helix bundle suffix domain-containing protein [Bacteroidaceae bacterium]
MEYKTKGMVLKKPVVWKDLYFYKKSDAIYQLTVEFCKRFLPAHGDRTVDQMVQAARSGKQNIIEGSEDGQTSSEMEIKLLNVARGSLQELREDYVDYLHTHRLSVWSPDSERQVRLRDYCHSHNDYKSYTSLADRMNDEEFANLLITLCHQTDKMMCSYVEKLEQRFVTEGGIKERMHAARTGYRKLQDEHMHRLEQESQALKKENQMLKEENHALKQEIQKLKAIIGEPKLS